MHITSALFCSLTLLFRDLVIDVVVGICQELNSVGTETDLCTFPKEISRK